MFFVTTFITGNYYYDFFMQMISSVSIYHEVAVICRFNPSLYTIIKNPKKIFATMLCTKLYYKCTHSNEKCNVE